MPSPPFRAEREGPAPKAWEGEVGVSRRSGIPHLTPTLSAPKGGEGVESQLMRWFGVIIWARGIMVLLCLLAAMSGAAAEPAMEPLDHAICRLIENSARANQLPVAFFTRLIWRESSFRAAVISPAGAEGIAQFMPGTARER